MGLYDRQEKQVLGLFAFIIVSLFATLIWIDISENEERTQALTECVEATPNDQKTIEHCMAKYSFIMGK